MKTIVITGATSFIGVHLLQQLSKEKSIIYAVVRPGSRNLTRLCSFLDIKVISCDIAEMAALDEKLPERIDVFYHLAWEGARRPYRDDEEMQHKNYKAAIVAYEAARNKGCKKFVGVGSQAEYGKTTGVITENFLPKPETMYGKYKFKAGQEIRTAGKRDRMDVIWPRIFSAYGHYDNPNTLLMSAIHKFRNNEPMALTECKQAWNFLYVKDIAKMLCLTGLHQCETGVYNFASRDNRMLRDYVTELKELTGSESELNFGAVPYGPEGIVSFRPDISKFIKNFPSFSFTSFREGVQELLEEAQIKSF